MSTLPRLRGKIEIQNGHEIAQLLRDLGPAFLPIMRKEMKAQLQPVADRLRELVPVDTGLLKESIVTGVSTRGGDVVGMVGVLKITKKRREALRRKYEAKGVTGQLFDAFYAHFSNYGTEFQRPQRWMNRAFDDSVNPFVEQFSTKLQIDLEDAVNQLKGALT